MLAHGLGERGQLPFPTSVATWILVGAVVGAFFLRWSTRRQPVLASAAAGRALVPARALLVVHRIGQVAAFALYLLCLVAAFVGFDAADDNLAPVTVYVVVWVGSQLIGGLVGDVWAAVNPIATLARGAEALGRMAGRGRAGADSSGPGWSPASLGHWPAAAALVVFLFYELSHPRGLNPRTLAWLLAAHAAITVAAGFWWGAGRVIEQEPLTVLFRLFGHQAPLFRPHPGPEPEPGADGGGLALRPPLSGLSNLAVGPGTSAVLLVVIAGTAFDGFSEGELGREILGGLFQWRLAWAELGLLVMAVALATAIFQMGVWWASWSTGVTFETAWDDFTPSLVPIAFGYAAAHYAQLLIHESQSFVFRLSDPLGRGWDLFGGEGALIWRVDPDVMVWIQLVVLVAGHVGAVVVAHDRALSRFPGRPDQAGRSLFGLVLADATYGALALWLLLSAT